MMQPLTDTEVASNASAIRSFFIPDTFSDGA